jgi:hypothetical protein
LHHLGGTDVGGCPENFTSTDTYTRDPGESNVLHTLLVIVLVFVLLSFLGGYSGFMAPHYGYGGGGVGLVLLIVLLVVLLR